MSLGIEKAREHRGHGTHTGQCERALAQAIHDNDELRAAIRRVRMRHRTCCASCDVCHECNQPHPCVTILSLGDVNASR